MTTQENPALFDVIVRLPQNGRFIIAKVEKVTEKPSNLTEDEWLHDSKCCCYFVHEYSRPLTHAQAFKTVYNKTLTRFTLTASIGENLYWFLELDVPVMALDLAPAAITA